MKKKQIKIRYAFTPRIDFGMLNEEYKRNTIKISRETYFKFLKARQEYEKLYYQLVEKIPRKRLTREMTTFQNVPKLCEWCGNDREQEK